MFTIVIAGSYYPIPLLPTLTPSLHNPLSRLALSPYLFLILIPSKISTTLQLLTYQPYPLTKLILTFTKHIRLT